MFPLCDCMAADVLSCTTVYRSNRMHSMCCPSCCVPHVGFNPVANRDKAMVPEKDTCCDTQLLASDTISRSPGMHAAHGLCQACMYTNAVASSLAEAGSPRRNM